MSASWAIAMDDQTVGRPKTVDVSPPIDDLQTRHAATRQIRSEELMQGCREVVILHNDQRYRLVVTRNGKLILQK